MLNVEQMSLPFETNHDCSSEWFPNALNTLNVVEDGGWPDTFGNALRQWHKVNLKAPITAISLFSGGGGLDIGFHDAGFQILECNEIEPLFSNGWLFCLSHTTSKHTVATYEIEITPPLRRNGESRQKGMTRLISHSSKSTSLLGLWKIYERYVQRYLLKDDLVQLFGYYQYKQTYSMSMKILDDSLCAMPFWRVVQKVTSGYGVGIITSISELTHLFELTSEEDLLSCLVMMKDHGYEIRNHKTNRQISNGMILIPYAFPTLNARSLQRLTRL